MSTAVASSITSWERVLHFSLRMLPLYKPRYLALLYETESTEKALQTAITSVAELTVRQYQSAGALHTIWKNMPDFAVQEPLWEILLAHEWFKMMYIETSPSLRRWGQSTVEAFGEAQVWEAWSGLYSGTMAIPPHVVENTRNIFGFDIETYASTPSGMPFLERFPHWGGYLVASHAVGLLPVIEQLEAMPSPQEMALPIPNSF